GGPQALDELLNPRDDRDPRGEPQYGPRRELYLEEARQQSSEDREDLEERRRLPGPGRMRVDAPPEHVDEEGPDHQDDVAADHARGDPERQGLEGGQRGG